MITETMTFVGLSQMMEAIKEKEQRLWNVRQIVAVSRDLFVVVFELPPA